MVNTVPTSWLSIPTQVIEQETILAAIDLGTNSLHMVVAKVPSTITPTSGKGGVPREAKNTAHKAGSIRIKRPEGLSHRKSRMIVSQIGSELFCCWVNMVWKNIYR